MEPKHSRIKVQKIIRRFHARFWVPNSSQTRWTTSRGRKEPKPSFPTWTKPWRLMRHSFKSSWWCSLWLKMCRKNGTNGYTWAMFPLSSRVNLWKLEQLEPRLLKDQNSFATRITMDFPEHAFHIMLSINGRYPQSPFNFRIFPNKNHPASYWGTPMTSWKPIRCITNHVWSQFFFEGDIVVKSMVCCKDGMPWWSPEIHFDAVQSYAV